MQVSQAYREAEVRLGLPPPDRRGRSNRNPQGIGFWALVAEDFRTHDHNLFEQGFWALFVHRFGNWRMGQPKIIRAPSTVLYEILFKLVEWMAGISLWYPVEVGRRVRIWHHSGIILSARYIGDDVQLRQNTTRGIRRTDRLGELPIIEAGVDIGAGAVIVGALLVGQGARIGANAVVTKDVPAGAAAFGNPAQILSLH
jgi:serine O-acetyltransferase